MLNLTFAKYPFFLWVTFQKPGERVEDQLKIGENTYTLIPISKLSFYALKYLPAFGFLLLFLRRYDFDISSGQKLLELFTGLFIAAIFYISQKFRIWLIMLSLMVIVAESVLMQSLLIPSYTFKYAMLFFFVIALIRDLIKNKTTYKLMRDGRYITHLLDYQRA